jgi:hypothetical protein
LLQVTPIQFTNKKEEKQKQSDALNDEAYDILPPSLIYSLFSAEHFPSASHANLNGFWEHLFCE